MFFCGYNLSCFAGCFDNDFFVNRLDGVHVDDTDVDSLLSQLRCRHHGFCNHDSCCDDGHITARTQLIALAQLDIRCLVIEGGNCSTAESHISRTVEVDDLFQKQSGTGTVRWVDYGHARNGAHQGNILKGLMAGSVFTYCDTCMGCTDLYIGTCITDGVSDNFKGPATGEHRKSRCADRLAR